jgi:hypothetical protein
MLGARRAPIRPRQDKADLDDGRGAGMVVVGSFVNSLRLTAVSASPVSASSRLPSPPDDERLQRRVAAEEVGHDEVVLDALAPVAPNTARGALAACTSSAVVLRPQAGGRRSEGEQNRAGMARPYGDWATPHRAAQRTARTLLGGGTSANGQSILTRKRPSRRLHGL